MSSHHPLRVPAITVAAIHVLVTMLPVAAFADEPARVTAANGSTQVYLAPNGVPVVDIANPNDAGLSHNQYTQYNVDSRGVVLNNGTAAQLTRQSQLAGQTLANLNLDAEARIILNEVVSPNRSVLAGFTEVLGGKADVIVANPFGITCSGCGFINTDRVSLTTGAPNISAAGALAGFSVNGGDVLISGAGLNASSQSFFDIVTRSLKVDGQINAHALNVVAGANNWSYATGSATAIATTAPVAGYAFDSTALGGVYADRIRIIATEAGVGVRTLGDVAATADDFSIDAAGRIELRGAISAQRDLNVRYTGDAAGGAGAITLDGASSSLSAGRNLALAADGAGVTLIDGALTAGEALTVSGATLDDSSQSGATRFGGGDVVLDVAGSGNISGSSWGAGGALSATLGSLTLSGGGTALYSGANTSAADSDLSLVATTGDLDLGAASIKSPGSVSLRAQQGGINIAAGDESVQAGADLALIAATSIGNAGTVLAGRAMSLQAASPGSGLTIDNSGRLQAAGALTLGASGGLANLNNSPAGVVLGDTLQIDVSGALSNSGLIHGANDVSVSAGTLSNSATAGLSSLGRLSLTATGGGITNHGSIFAGSRLEVTAIGQAFTNAGTAAAGVPASGSGDMTFNVDSFVNTGAVTAEGDVRIDTRDFRNDPVGGLPTIVTASAVPITHVVDVCILEILGSCVISEPRTVIRTTQIGDSGNFNCNIFGFQCAHSRVHVAEYTIDQELVGGMPAPAQLIAAGDITLNYSGAARNLASVISGNNVAIFGASSASAFENQDFHLEQQLTNRRLWIRSTTSDRYFVPITQWEYHVPDLNAEEPGVNWVEMPDQDTALAQSYGFVVASTVTQNTNAGIFATNNFSYNGPALNNRSGTRAAIANPIALPGAASLNLALPANPNGFFVPSRNPGSRFLIETNPLYTSGSALGSDYLAQLLGYNVDTLQRRLGDANYEGKLVREQLIAQTGSNILQGFASEAEQIKGLMESASVQSGELGLTFGNALTPEQVAGLKQDLVWMEERQVNGQTVLVPVVYLAAATRDAIASGAVISATNVSVRSDTLTNTGGTIQAGGELSVQTTGDIRNTSGTIAGGTVDLTSTGGSIRNETEATTRGDANVSRTQIGETGTITAQDSLSIDAAKDVVVQGAELRAGGDASISAGGNVSIDTIQDRSAESTASSSSGFMSSRSTATTTRTVTQIGSKVEAAGDVSIRSGGDVTVGGSQVNAGGDASIDATGDLNVVDRQNERSVRTIEKSTGFSTDGASISHDKVTEETTAKTSTSSGAAINAGGNAELKAGETVTIKGSDVAAGGDLAVSGTDINMVAGEDTTLDATRTQRESLSIGVHADSNSYGATLTGEQYTADKKETTSTARTSTLRAGGDMNRDATGTITDVGTQIEAGGDFSQSATTIDSRAAENTATSTSSSRSDKVSIGMSVDYHVGEAIDDADKGSSAGAAEAAGGPTSGVTMKYRNETKSSSSASSQAVTGRIKAGGKISSTSTQDTTLEGTQLESGGDTDIAARDLNVTAAQDTQTSSSSEQHIEGAIRAEIDVTGKPGGKLSGGYGDKSTEGTSSNAVVGTIKSGGDINVRTTGDTRLEGTRIESKGDTTIDAGGDVKLDAARNTASSSASNLDVSGSVSAGKSHAGVEGRLEMGESSATSSEAVTGSVEAGGNLTIRSGKDVQVEGADLKAGSDATISAEGKVDVKDAVSTSESESSEVNASVTLSGGKGQKGKLKKSKDPPSAVGGSGVSSSSEKTSVETKKAATIEAGGDVRVESKERDGEPSQ